MPTRKYKSCKHQKYLIYNALTITRMQDMKECLFFVLVCRYLAQCSLTKKAHKLY